MDYSCSIACIILVKVQALVQIFGITKKK